MTGKTSIIDSSPIPASLADYVRRFVARSRKLAAIEAAGAAVAFLVVWTVAWAMVDRLLPMPPFVRLILLFTQLCAAVMVLIRPLGRLLRQDVPWHRAAAEIERREPVFGGELQTALSQMLAPPEFRGSAAMLNQVVEEAAAKASSSHAESLLPLRPAMKPAAIAVGGLVLLGVMLHISWLDLPRLLKREFFPLSGAAPVTTTQLQVTPGSAEVVQGESFTVSVRAERLGDAEPMLRWRGDDRLWSSTVMTPNGTLFLYRFGSVDRPMRYEVSGGDATSPTYDVRIIPRPAVSEFRIHYTYPNWTELTPFDVVNTTGALEGPAGTMAQVSFVASEPLTAATCTVDGTHIDTTSTVDPAVRTAVVPIKRNVPWQLDLTSTRNVPGTGPSAMTIRAFPQQPPVVRLLLPNDENELRLHPRDVLTLHYEVNDQYVLSKVAATIGVNAAEPMKVAIPLGANHRTQLGSFDVDLAELGVSLGDVVTIAVNAENKGGMHGASQPCRVIVSPRSVDLNAAQRLSELREASRFAGVLVTEMSGALKALEESPPGDAKEARDEKIAPHLATADTAAGELSRTLLRAASHSNGPELSIALEWLVDATQRAASAVEAADAAVMVDQRDALRDRMNRVMEPANQLQRSLESLWRGERAAQLLAEHDDAKSADERASKLNGTLGDTMRRSAQRARQDEAAGLAELGIDPHAGDIAVQLQHRVDEGMNTARQFGPVDFASAAGEWAQKGPEGGTGLVARLTVASEAEAVKPGADFVWARDLQLAARAARRIDTSVATPAANAEQPRPAYPGAIGAIQRVHEMRRVRAPVDQLVEPTKAADAARKKLRHWADDEDSTTQPATNPSVAEQDRALLEAAAAAAEQKYDEMMRLDHSPQAADAADNTAAVNTSNEDKPKAADLQKLRAAVAASQRLERLNAQQRQLRRETEKGTEAQMADLAKRQAELTDAIAKAREQAHSQPGAEGDAQHDKQPDGDAEAKPDETQQASKGDTRESAMNAIRSAQERLAEMPKQISEAQKAADEKMQTAQAAEQARQDAAAAPDDEKPAAEQKATEAQQAADAAAAHADAAGKAVSPDAAAQISAGLKQFAPEATPAVETLDQQLAPALSAMKQADAHGDSAAGQKNAQAAKQAVAEAQHRLSDGLQSLLLRDPLTTAKFFSSHAQQAMTKQPGDKAAAVKLQRGAAAALEQAWDDALHQAAAQRISGMSSMAGVLRIYSADGIGPAVAAPGAEPVPAAREWGHLRERSPDDLSAASRDADPAEYQDALRVYFRALAREREGGGK